MQAPRRLQPKPAQKHELEAFAEKYDTLAVIYGDPVEVVFEVMARAVKNGNDILAHTTADTLMGYRFPKVKAQELAADKSAPPAVINIQFVSDADKTQIAVVNQAPRIDLEDISDLLGG